MKKFNIRKVLDGLTASSSGTASPQPGTNQNDVIDPRDATIGAFPALQGGLRSTKPATIVLLGIIEDNSA